MIDLEKIGSFLSSDVLLKVIELSRTIPPQLLVTGGFLCLLAISFLVFFFMPGTVHWLRLRKISKNIELFNNNTPPEEFKKLFARDKQLANFWREYHESLHEQREYKDGIFQTSPWNIHRLRNYRHFYRLD